MLHHSAWHHLSPGDARGLLGRRNRRSRTAERLGGRRPPLQKCAPLRAGQPARPYVGLGKPGAFAGVADVAVARHIHSGPVATAVDRGTITGLSRSSWAMRDALDGGPTARSGACGSALSKRSPTRLRSPPLAEPVPAPVRMTHARRRCSASAQRRHVGVDHLEREGVHRARRLSVIVRDAILVSNSSSVVMSPPCLGLHDQARRRGEATPPRERTRLSRSRLKKKQYASGRSAAINGPAHQQLRHSGSAVRSPASRAAARGALPPGADRSNRWPWMPLSGTPAERGVVHTST